MQWTTFRYRFGPPVGIYGSRDGLAKINYSAHVHGDEQMAPHATTTAAWFQIMIL